MATVVGSAGYSSAQPSSYDPAMQNLPICTRIWGTTGNTDTCIDAVVHPSSCVVVTPTSLPAGDWKVVVSQGSFVVTSTDSESAGLTYNYTVL